MYDSQLSIKLLLLLLLTDGMMHFPRLVRYKGNNMVLYRQKTVHVQLEVGRPATLPFMSGTI